MKQGKEVRSCFHGVNDNDAVVVCEQRDEFDEVACGVGANEGESWRMFVGVVVELDRSMFVGMGDVSIAKSVLPGRAVDLHEGYRNTIRTAQQGRVLLSGRAAHKALCGIDRDSGTPVVDERLTQCGPVSARREVFLRR